MLIIHYRPNWHRTLRLRWMLHRGLWLARCVVGFDLHFYCSFRFQLDFGAVSAFTRQESAQPSSYAVVIGVSQFAHLPSEDWLNFADADARDFYNFITSPRGRSFPPENVFLLTNENATYQAIRSRLGSTQPGK